MQLTLIVRLVDESSRHHMHSMLLRLANDEHLQHAFPDGRIDLVELENDDALYPYRSRLSVEARSFLVVISDCLVEDDQVFSPTSQSTWLPSSFAKDLLCSREWQEGRIATVAVMPYPSRVTDIDRTLSATCQYDELLRVIKRCAAKLELMSPPESRRLECQFQVRPIRDCTELEACFRLRHKVYTVMGYLPPEVEEARSGLEINGGDLSAIEFGAFVEQPEHGESLVGTARLAITSPDPYQSVSEIVAKYESWTRELADDDPVLRLELQRPNILPLPIFNAVPGMLTPDLISETCAELSRVVVDRDYRGVGISKVLIQRSICEARELGIGHLFLECLPIHVPMYNKYGFQELNLQAHRDKDIRKTLIPMELKLDDEP